LDRDSDGFLGAKDLEKCLKQYSGSKNELKKVEEIIYEVDDKGTGKIGFDTVCEVMNRVCQFNKTRAKGTGTNVFRSLLEFAMFDSHDTGTLDKYELQQMLYVYFGLSGRELDQKTEMFVKAVGGREVLIDFSTFCELMNRFNLVCNVPTNAFMPQHKGDVSERKMSLNAAAHSNRLANQMKHTLANAEGSGPKVLARRRKVAIPLPIPEHADGAQEPQQPATARSRPEPHARRAGRGVGASGSQTDRYQYEAQMKEDRFKRMATIVQGEMEMERMAKEAAADKNRLPPLVKISTKSATNHRELRKSFTDLNNPVKPDKENPVPPKAPKDHTSHFRRRGNQRRASVVNGEIVPLPAEPATVRPLHQRAQMNGKFVSNTKMQDKVASELRNASQRAETHR